MGHNDDPLSAYVRVRAHPRLLAKAMVRILHPHPTFPAVNVTHPWGAEPWSAVVGNGTEILEELLAGIPASNQATLQDWNEYARVQYERDDYPEPFNPYTMDQQITDDQMQSFYEIPETMAGEHIFLAIWLACGQDSVKGWLNSSPHFAIKITSYELGGSELLYKVTTTKRCMFTPHMLVAEGFPQTTLDAFMFDDDFEVAEVVGEVHNHYAKHGETAMADIVGFDELIRLDYDTLDLGLLKLEDYGDVSKPFNAVSLFSEQYEDGWAFFNNLCRHPDSFFPRVYATMDVWCTWKDLVYHRNKLCHAAHVIQRWARCCLYDPQFKKGRRHVMQLFDDMS